MRIVRRIPPFDAGRHATLISEGWTPLKEPGNLAMALLAAVPLMVVNVIASGIVILLFTPFTLAGPGENITISIGIIPILGFVLLMVAHELIHLAFIPGFLRSDKTYASISYAGPCVATEEVLTKRRHMLISVAPFVVISLLTPLMLGVAGMLGPLAICLVLLNALGSSVDLLSFLLVAFQAPAGARLVSNGWKTYWKPG